jgi:hypothetical protein
MKLNNSNQRALMLQIITNPKTYYMPIKYYIVPPVDGLEKMGSSSF